MEPIEEVDQVGTERKTPREREDELFDLLSKNACTTKEVAEKIGITVAGASSKLNNLVKQGFVERKYYKGLLHYYVEK